MSRDILLHCPTTSASVQQRLELFVQEFLPKDYDVANFFWSQNPDLTYRQVCSHGVMIRLQTKTISPFSLTHISSNCLCESLAHCLVVPSQKKEVVNTNAFFWMWQVAVACIHTEEGRITLTDKRLRIFRDALVDEKELGNDTEVEEALSTYFGISLWLSKVHLGNDFDRQLYSCHNFLQRNYEELRDVQPFPCCISNAYQTKANDTDLHDPFDVA